MISTLDTHSYLEPGGYLEMEDIALPATSDDGIRTDDSFLVGMSLLTVEGAQPPGHVQGHVRGGGVRRRHSEAVQMAQQHLAAEPEVQGDGAMPTPTRASKG